MYPPTILAINSAKVFLNRYYMVEPLDNSPDKIFQHKVCFAGSKDSRLVCLIF
jgi:hypothetical protein